MKQKYNKLVVVFILALLIIPGITRGQEIKASGGALISKVAPGEQLPVSINLINFGSDKRVDVMVVYVIVDSFEEILTQETETVAVETTAKFFKNITIPLNATPGIYTARASITYEDQETLAESSVQFTIERKFFGFFLSDFIFYIVLLSVLVFFAFLLGRYFIQRTARGGFSPHDYSHIPKKMRIYYELISDAVMQMRLKVGEDAHLIANKVKGLQVHSESGEVLAVNRNPAEVMADLVYAFEIKFGRKINFSMGSKNKVVVKGKNEK